MKKKVIVASLLCALSLSSMTGMDNNYFTSPSIALAEQVQDIGVKDKTDKKDANQKEEKVVVEHSTDNYKLINDKTETLKEEDVQAITKELSSIYEKGAKPNDLKPFIIFVPISMT